VCAVDEDCCALTVPTVDAEAQSSSSRRKETCDRQSLVGSGPPVDGQVTFFISFVDV